MSFPSIPLVRSVGMLIGSIIGVGVFGLPYALSRGGMALGLLLLVVMAILLTTMLFMYTEVVLQTPGRHRLIGYAKRYLHGSWWVLALVCFSASVWGAMLAYLLVGGDFLSSLFSLFGFSVSSFWSSVLLWGIASVCIYQGLRFASRLEVYLIGILLFLFFFMILSALPHVEAVNIFQLDWTLAFAPYGVVLFALSGGGVLPEIKEILGHRAKDQLGWTVAIGMAFITLLYALFSFTVVGALGDHVTPVAFDGLVPLLGEVFRVVVALIGSITILSIFMLIGVELRHIFQYDFSLKKYQAWALAVGMPFVLFLCGVREFITVVGFVGGIFGSTLGILYVWMYERMHARLSKDHHHCFHVPRWVSLLLVLVFLAGIFSEIISLVH